VTTAAPTAPAAAAPAPATAAPVATTTVARTATATPAVAAVTTAAPAASEGGELSFIVREDTWVQVQLADGTNAISRLLKAGSTESVTLDGPVTLVVGNVAGIDVTLRGQPYPLKSVKNNNTARVKIK
ncbi:MAG TPA: DUF4115 domain-containing protein, partial [Burkholderiaceae bacterium]